MTTDVSLEDIRFGFSNGPGPLHVLTDDRSATLCGVKRFIETRAPAFWWEHRLCSRCVSRHNAKVPQEVDSGEAEQAWAGAAAAIDDMKAPIDALKSLRRQIADALPVLRAAKSAHLDECLYWAHEGGCSFAELGEMVGVTRQ